MDNGNGLVQVLGGAFAATFGAGVTLVGTWVNQRAEHKRQQQSERTARRVDAYSDWAAALDGQFNRLRFAANRANSEGLSAEECERRTPELTDLWEKIREADIGLKRVAYCLRLLESDEKHRKRVMAITEGVTAIYDTFPEWRMFEKQVHGTRWGDLVAPYRKELTALLDEVAEEQQ